VEIRAKARATEEADAVLLKANAAIPHVRVCAGGAG